MRWMVVVGLLCACDHGAEDRRRLEAIQVAYSEAISSDFPAALHGEKVTKVLASLDAFPSGSEQRGEADALARRIRETQARHPVHVEAPSEPEFEEAKEVVAEASSRDADEAIWMRALRVGAFRADFERYWLGCFMPVAGNPDRWRPLDVPPCRARPGMDRVGEVRFEAGQIKEIVSVDKLLEASAKSRPE